MAKKPLDPYSAEEFKELAGGDVGQQYLQRRKLEKEAGGWLTSAAEALAGVPEAGKKAFQASKKDVLANLAAEQYRRRRSPIGAALTAAEQRRRDAQRQFSQQEADMAKMALQEKSVADLAMAKSIEQRAAMGHQAEKDLEMMANHSRAIESMKEGFDDWFDADQEGFYDTAKNFTDQLPPHLRFKFFETYVMPTYRGWTNVGEPRPNPYSPEGGASGGVAQASPQDQIPLQKADV
jgi:hypothetical protein